MASSLHELTGFYLAVDCMAPGCGGERTFAIIDLASTLWASLSCTGANWDAKSWRHEIPSHRPRQAAEAHPPHQAKGGGSA